jgi:hypothetical protein
MRAIFRAPIALDKNGDIVICDEADNSVDIILPPYNKISGTLGSGYNWPLTVRINAKNDRHMWSMKAHRAMFTCSISQAARSRR